MTRRLMAGLMVSVLVALPLACGDDDDSGGGLGASSDSTEAEASAETETDVTDETEAPAPDDTEADDSRDDTGTDDTEADDSTEEPTGGDLVRWCEISNDLNDTTELDDAEDPAEIEAAYNDVEELADEYVDVTPDEIRDDAETVVGAIADLRDLLESHDWDVNEVATDPAFEEIFTPEVNDAGTRLDEFEDAHCS